jgi:hypothetical protein
MKRLASADGYRRTILLGSVPQGIVDDLTVTGVVIRRLVVVVTDGVTYEANINANT